MREEFKTQELARTAKKVRLAFSRTSAIMVTNSLKFLPSIKHLTQDEMVVPIMNFIGKGESERKKFQR